jgi:hypothetical protein|tara:strand:+ start:203 stop:439 length:237 start_codon:yes stop_codon:yes gene_type:complete
MSYRESAPLATSPSELGPGDGIRKARRAIRNKLKKCGLNTRCGTPYGIGAKIKRAVSGAGTGIRKPMRNKASKRYKTR